MEVVVSHKARRIPSWLGPALGYAISIASLIWVFYGVDFKQVVRDFTTMHWGWITLAVLSDISVYIWQGWRWNLLLSPVVRVPLWRSVRAIYVGLFANEVLPLRTGEIIRCYLQARWSDIPFSVGLSSAIIERIFDAIWLVLTFYLTTVFITMPRFLVQMGRILAGVAIVAIFLLWLVMFRKHHAHSIANGTRWSKRLEVLIEDLHLMGNSRSFYSAALASLAYLLLQIIPVYALMRGYGLELSVWAATVVLVILRLGTVIPQAPGNVGSTQALIKLALGLFAVDKTTAAGLSLVMWGVITLPLLMVGFVALLVTEMRFDELRHHARTHMRSVPQPTAETRSH